MKSNTNSVKSFEVDHRTLAPGLYLRQTFRLGLFSKVYIWDLRLVAPQLAQNEALSVSVMHTLEHFLAFHLKQDKHVGSKIISVNAMGCGTGFYIETSSNIGHDLIDALIRVVTLPSNLRKIFLVLMKYSVVILAVIMSWVLQWFLLLLFLF